MIEKILSVVIPTYNMEAYLGRCLDSLVNAKDVLDELEIIVVNDGSKDRSLEIANSYKERFSDSIVIIDKPNGNYGSCINAALKIAVGKYFRIVDADDWVDSHGLAEMVQAIKKREVDLVITDFETKLAKRTIIHKSSPNLYGKIFSEDSEEIKELRPDRELKMHRMTYRTAILKQIDYRQTEGISYTDTEYVFYPLAVVRTVILMDIVVYCYWIGREGQTVSFESRSKHFKDMVCIAKRMLLNSLKDRFTNIQKIRLEFLSFVIATTFHNALVIQNITKENKFELEGLWRDVMAYGAGLSEMVLSTKCVGIPYINIWIKYHVQVIPPALYRMIHQIVF